MGSKLNFTTCPDELAVDIMLWLAEHPEAEGISTLKQAIYKLGYKMEEVKEEEQWEHFMTS